MDLSYGFLNDCSSGAESVKNLKETSPRLKIVAMFLFCWWRACATPKSAATTLRSEHLRELFVLQAALEELLLRQLAVVVLVHFRKDVFGPFFGRVGRPVRGAGSEHVVDGLEARFLIILVRVWGVFEVVTCTILVISWMSITPLPSTSYILKAHFNFSSGVPLDVTSIANRNSYRKKN